MFDGRRAFGHGDGRGNLQFASRVGHALGVVACDCSACRRVSAFILSPCTTYIAAPIWPSDASSCGIRTCRTCYDTLPPLLVCQMCHLVVCSAQLEAEYGLKIFSFEVYLALQPIAQVDCMCEWCFLDNIVDARGKDEAEVLCQYQCHSSQAEAFSRRHISHRGSHWATRSSPVLQQ